MPQTWGAGVGPRDRPRTAARPPTYTAAGGISAGDGVPGTQAEDSGALRLTRTARRRPCLWL